MTDSTRLLVIVNVYRPDLGGGVLFADLCEGLVERGVDVTVRCAVPYYPEWRDKTGANGWHILRGREHGVWVERYGLYIPRRPNHLLPRMLYEASFFASLIRDVPGPGEFDAVMVFCPLVGSVAYGALAARAANAPLWLNVQDLPTDAAHASGIVRSGRVADFLSRVEHTLFNRADVWSTISPVMADRLSAFRSRDQPLHVLPNWVHRSLESEIRSRPDKVGRGPSKPIRLLYSGNIGTKQTLLDLCRSLAESEAPFRFRIRGGGGRASAVRSWVREAADQRFSFHELTDESGLADALHETDLFVVTETGGAGGSFIPSKILPAMASGTPLLVVCDADSPLAIEMGESGAGPAFRWSEVDRIPPLLTDLPVRFDAFHGWQRNAVERSKRYGRDAMLDRYAAVLRRIVNDHPTRAEP